MANYIYDKETDTLYVSDGDGLGWLGVLFILTLPFIFIASFLQQYAEFVNSNSQFAFLIFLALSTLLSIWLCTRCKTKFLPIDILASIISMLPIALVQKYYAIPIIQSDNEALFIVIEWFFPTFFTIGISFFLTQLGLLLRNGITHLIISLLYLWITLSFIF